MVVKQITASNADEKIKQLYETAFPEDEQILWKGGKGYGQQILTQMIEHYKGQSFVLD